MLRQLALTEFLEAVAARKAVPGGGSVAALSGALAAGLVSMAAEFSRDKTTADRARDLAAVLLRLVDEDADAFARKDSREATDVPMRTAEYSYEILGLADVLLRNCNPRLITDIGVAAKMAEASVEGALLNVMVNLVSLEDEGYKKDMMRRASKLCLTAPRARIVLSHVQARLE
jgi:methenyltetrahydrofolate cyclohydrolase